MEQNSKVNRHCFLDFDTSMSCSSMQWTFMQFSIMHALTLPIDVFQCVLDNIKTDSKQNDTGSLL